MFRRTSPQTVAQQSAPPMSTNNARFYLAMAEQGMGLIYGGEIGMHDRLEDGRLVAVLEDYAPTEQGVFLCFPKREQQSPALRQFVNVAKEVLRLR
jgi:DNA-binding transcriptional LysR family regulator